MKKILIITIFILFSFMLLICVLIAKKPTYTQDEDFKIPKIYQVDPEYVLKQINISAESTEKARKIFYKFIKKEHNLSNKDFKRYLSLGFFRAVEYDLNDDGENEIIGFVGAIVYDSQEGQQLFILHKNKDGKYEDLSQCINFEYGADIYILRNKDNNFHQIAIHSSSRRYDLRPFLLRYQNGNYVNFYDSCKLTI